MNLIRKTLALGATGAFVLTLTLTPLWSGEPVDLPTKAMLKIEKVIAKQWRSFPAQVFSRARPGPAYEYHVDLAPMTEGCIPFVVHRTTVSKAASLQGKEMFRMGYYEIQSDKVFVFEPSKKGFLAMAEDAKAFSFLKALP